MFYDLFKLRSGRFPSFKYDIGKERLKVRTSNMKPHFMIMPIKENK